MSTPEGDSSLSLLAPQWFKKSAHAPGCSPLTAKQELHVASSPQSKVVVLSRDETSSISISSSGNAGSAIRHNQHQQQQQPRRLQQQFVNSSALAMHSSGNNTSGSGLRGKAPFSDQARPWAAAPMSNGSPAVQELEGAHHPSMSRNDSQHSSHSLRGPVSDPFQRASSMHAANDAYQRTSSLHVAGSAPYHRSTSLHSATDTYQRTTSLHTASSDTHQRSTPLQAATNPYPRSTSLLTTTDAYQRSAPLHATSDPFQRSASLHVASSETHRGGPVGGSPGGRPSPGPAPSEGDIQLSSRLSADPPLQSFIPSEARYSNPIAAGNRGALKEMSKSMELASDMGRRPAPELTPAPFHHHSMPTSVSGYQKVVFEKEYPSLKDNKSPIAYSPREAPYTQSTFLASRNTTNWTSRLADAIPQLPLLDQGEPNQGGTATASPPQGQRDPMDTPSLIAPGGAQALPPGAAAASAGQHVGWSSVASHALGAAVGGAVDGSTPDTETLREQLALRQSKQLVPVMAKKADDIKKGQLGSTRGNRLQSVGGATSAKGGSTHSAAAPLDSKGLLRPGMSALTGTNSSTLTAISAKKAGGALDKPCGGIRTQLNAPTSGVLLSKPPSQNLSKTLTLNLSKPSTLNLAKPVGSGPLRVLPGKHLGSETGTVATAANSPAATVATAATDATPTPAPAPAANQPASFNSTGPSQLAPSGFDRHTANTEPGEAGQAWGEFGSVHEEDCSNATTAMPPVEARLAGGRAKEEESRDDSAAMLSCLPEDLLLTCDDAAPKQATPVTAVWSPPQGASQADSMWWQQRQQEVGGGGCSFSDTAAPVAPPPGYMQRQQQQVGVGPPGYMHAHHQPQSHQQQQQQPQSHQQQQNEIAGSAAASGGGGGYSNMGSGYMHAPPHGVHGVVHCPMPPHASHPPQVGHAPAQPHPQLHMLPGGGGVPEAAMCSTAASPPAKFEVPAEEEAFLRSLGWTDVDDGTDDVLTDEEIAAFRKQQTQPQPLASSYGVGQPGASVPYRSQW